MAFCFVHPAVEATGNCDDCKKPICTRCTKGTLEGFMCPPCAQKRYGRRKLMTALKVSGVAAVLVGLGVFGLVAVGGSGKPKAKPKDDPKAEKDPYVQSLRDQRAQAPCDKNLIRTLAKELNRLDRYADTVEDASSYFAKCEDFPVLRWDVIYALHQLGRYAEAIKYEDDLITRDPFDSDFWWWRGEDRGRTNDNELALADYRQSFANSEDAGGSRFPAARILDVGGPAGHPCEGVMALDFFTKVHDGELASDLEQRARALDESAQCAGARGKGTIELPPSGSADHVKVTIGGVEGSFVVEEKCGTTAVTTAFAQLAQLPQRTGPKIQTMAAGAIHTGAQASATLTLGKATAPATELAVVDSLPDGVDGVIGLSTLWKFSVVRRDDGGLTLSE